MAHSQEDQDRLREGLQAYGPLAMVSGVQPEFSRFVTEFVGTAEYKWDSQTPQQIKYDKGKVNSKLRRGILGLLLEQGPNFDMSTLRPLEAWFAEGRMWPGTPYADRHGNKKPKIAAAHEKEERTTNDILEALGLLPPRPASTNEPQEKATVTTALDAIPAERQPSQSPAGAISSSYEAEMLDNASKGSREDIQGSDEHEDSLVEKVSISLPGPDSSDGEGATEDDVEFEIVVKVVVKKKEQEAKDFVVFLFSCIDVSNSSVVI